MRDMATEYYHWFFLPTGHGIPEHMIGADPAFRVRALVGPLLGEGASTEPAVMQDYIRCFGDPGTIAGSCADYRSATGIDLVHDDQTFAAGQRVECPVPPLWGKQSFVGRDYDRSTWRAAVSAGFSAGLSRWRAGPIRRAGSAMSSRPYPESTRTRPLPVSMSRTWETTGAVGMRIVPQLR